MTENRKVGFVALAIIVVTSMIISTSICLLPSEGAPGDAIHIYNSDDLARIGTDITDADGNIWSLDAYYIQENDISLTDRTVKSLTVTFETGPTWGDDDGQSYDFNLHITVTSEYPLSNIEYELCLGFYEVVSTGTADQIPAVDRDDIYDGSYLRLYVHDNGNSVFDVTLDIPIIPDYGGYDGMNMEYDMKDFSMSETYTCNLFPIGGNGRPFNGIYDGRGYTIDGLDQNISFGSSLSSLPNYLLNNDNNLNNVYAGLFAFISGGSVFDLGLTGGTIRLENDGSETGFYGNLYVGGIAGLITDSTWIMGCYNTNTISAVSTHELRGFVVIGGIVGYSDDYYSNEGGVIAMCFNGGDLKSGIGMSYIGGIVGSDYGTEITECYNVGNIECIAPFTHKNSALGGLVGMVTDCEIKNSYNRGDITGYVFGFPDIWPCNSFIGGLAGDCQGGMYFTNCYSTGSISFVEAPYQGDDIFHNEPWTAEEMENQDSRPYLSGGVIGYLCGFACITNCYYLEDLELFGSKDAYYYFVLDGVEFDIYDTDESDPRTEQPSGSKTAEELKNQDPEDENFPYYIGETIVYDNSIPGWDFGTIETESAWGFDLMGYNDGYPILTMFLGTIYVMISPEDSGMIDNTEFYSAFDGSIEAIPNEGFSFKEWGSGETDSVLPLSISHWRQIISLTADFTQLHKVSASSDDGSTITNEGDNFVAPGGDITFEFGEKSGYDISAVYVDGAPLSPSGIELGEYTFQNVTGDHTISVTSQKKNYLISAMSDNGSTVSPGSTSVEHGNNITFVFDALSGREVAMVYVDGDPINQDQMELGEYTFQNVTSTHSISVTSQTKRYLVSAETDNGSIISPDSTRVELGGSITFEFDVKSGYEMIAVYVDGVPLSQSDMELGEYTFQNVTGTHSISVTSKAIWHIISAEADENSVIDPYGNNTVYDGESITFEFSAKSGCEISTVYVDGDPLSPSDIELGEYTFQNVDNEHTISVTSHLKKHLVSAVSDNNSTISPGSTWVGQGSSITFEFSASSGYEIATVYVDGAPLSQSKIELGEYTFQNVIDTHSISVTSQTKRYLVSATSDNGSKISPASTRVEQGGSITFEFGALSGHRITTVYVDGDLLSQSEIELGEYTFQNVNGEHTISVRSEPTSVVVSAEADEGSTISPGSTRVPYGESITFEFSAKEGYRLKDVQIDGSSHSELIDAGTYTFTNVNVNHSIRVISEEIASTVVLTVNTSGSGTITYSINGGETLQYRSPVDVTIGSSITLYAKGTDDFEFSKWIMKGETFDSSPLTISNLETSAVVSVVFSIPGAGDGGLSPEIEAVILVVVVVADAVILVCLILLALENFGYLALVGEGPTKFLKIKRTFKIIAMIVGAVAAVTLVGAHRIKKGGNYEFELKIDNKVLDDLAADDYLVEYQIKGSEEWVQITDELGKYTIPDVNGPMQIKVTYRGA